MTARDIHACLVHERPDCVADLVRNLHHLAPDSPILLYDGGRDPALLGGVAWDRHGAVVHPSPRPMRWGLLHEFALDCMRWALEHLPFDTLTIVDSDQLATRAGHAARIAAFLREHPEVGMLGSAPPPRAGAPRPAPAVAAWAEFRTWRPFLRRFPDGEAKWAHWTFWPSTVFTADAARDVVRLWDGDAQLRELMRRSRMWATEEVLLPTLVALLGHEVAETPCRHDWVRYRARWTRAELDRALEEPDAFWIHPVPRRLDDPLRARVRERHGHYGEPAPPPAAVAAPPRAPPPRRALRAVRPDAAVPEPRIPPAVLEEMRRIEGWLADDEAALLYAACAGALADPALPRRLVEIGSLCGKGTVVMARAAEASDPGARVHAIDPLDGTVGTRERPHQLGPTRDRLESALARGGLADRVEIHAARAPDVAWGEPVAVVFIDGLHDHASAAADFGHLDPFVAPGGLVAFHDVADWFPGVQRLVREVLASGRYSRAASAGSLVVLRKAPAPALPAPAPAIPGPRAIPPLVSCIMPTARRRAFVPQAVRLFLAQDHPELELVVVDDGPEPVQDLLPDDPRIAYVRLSGRRSVGAKRNLACERARGELVLHWDDDDWMAPRRARVQAEALAGSGADLCGLDRVLYHEPSTGRSWQYVFQGGRRPWVAGNTFCYRRALWRAHPFPDVDVGEDARFLWSRRAPRALALGDDTFIVAMVHRGNADPKRVTQGCWHPHATEAIRALLGEDLERYREIVGAADAPLRPAAGGR